MGLKLQEFVDRCLGIAEGRGLSADKPITLKVREPTTDEETLIVVAYTEPHYLILPLNVTWIDASPTSSDYREAFKRESKNASGGLQNTWVSIDTYEEIFSPPQYYAPEDNPQPVYTSEDLDEILAGAINKNGDSMIGPLGLRSLPSGEQYGLDEAIPRNYHVKQQNQQTQSFYNIILGIYRRLGAVETLAQDNKRRLDELGDIGNGGGGNTGNGVVSKVFDIDQESDTWTLTHNFGTDNIIYTIFDSEGEQVLPAMSKIIEGTSKNVSVVIFAEAVTGKAVLVKADG